MTGPTKIRAQISLRKSSSAFIIWGFSLQYRWRSFLEAEGQQLVDLYFWITSENFSTATRPAYSEFLPLYQNWTIPFKQRKTAESRTQHLDLGSALRSADDEEEPSGVTTRTGGADATSGLPEAMTMKPKKDTLSTAQTRVRLETLMKRSFGPLEELLGKKKYMMSETKPSSLDALAIGYFGLVTKAQVKNRWAVNIMADCLPNLTRYIRDHGIVLWEE
jgi:sorting and assembly machinery component 37